MKTQGTAAWRLLREVEGRAPIDRNICRDAIGESIRLFEALEEIVERDERNGSLPPAYRQIIDRALTGTKHE